MIITRKQKDSPAEARTPPSVAKPKSAASITKAVVGVKILSVLSDLLIVFLAYGVAACWRLGSVPGALYFWDRLELVTGVALATLLVFYVHDVYPRFRTYSSFNGLNHLGKALAYVWLIQGFSVYLGGVTEAFGRGIFSMALFMTSSSCSALRRENARITCMFFGEAR